MNNLQMIFGPPGSGKTTFLISLLKELLVKTAPQKIAFVSFTKKGSYEGRDRACKDLGYKEKDFPYFRTIHSLAFRSLGTTRYEMMGRRNYKEFSKALGMNFVGYYTEDFIGNDDKYLFYNSMLKNNKYYAEKMLPSLNFNKVALVNNNYARYKKEMGLVDFDDLLVNYVNKGNSLPVEVAIIDEAQDLTRLQWEFCNVAFKNCKQVYVAGDDDQAIYEWSGADTKYFLGLTKNNKVRVLDKSYRLKENILNFSKKVAKRIGNRIEKEFSPISSGGNIHFHNSLENVSINNQQSYYFLCRNNFHLRFVKEYLMKLGIVFWNKHKYSLDKAIYDSIVKYEYARKFSPNTVNDFKIYFKEGLEGGAVWYDVFDLSNEDSLYYRSLFKHKVNIDPEYCNITVSTIHGVKGGEADNVVLMLDVTRNVKINIDKVSGIESELRCLYVALTRAKENLHIVYSQGKYGYDSTINSIKEGM